MWGSGLGVGGVSLQPVGRSPGPVARGLQPCGLAVRSHAWSQVSRRFSTVSGDLLKSDIFSISVNGTSVEEPDYTIPEVAYVQVAWRSLLETSRGR